MCPHLCKIAEGKTGICGVRKNTGEKIELLTYGVVSGFSLDPVEKKPLYHFFPGNNILSVGSYGCNMRCDFCQNYHISQNVSNSYSRDTSPDLVLKQVLSSRQNLGIAFTYNEPVIWFEYIRDTARLVKDAGMYTAMVTNGFVTEEPLSEYLQIIDAFNVDLKSFNEDFYKRIAGARLGPVKNSLKMIVKAGRHLEITSLVITGLNDKPLKPRPLPPHDTLKQFYELAMKHLTYVYLGNTMSEMGQDTLCPRCNNTITTRTGYYIQNKGTVDGLCQVCGLKIYSYFTPFS